MKKIGLVISVVMLLVCSSCSAKIEQASYPQEVKSLDQLKQFRLIWEVKTRYEGFTVKKDAKTGKTSFEQGVQFMSGDWDYDFLSRQTLQQAIDEEKTRTFFKFVPFYEKIDKMLSKNHLDPAVLVANWNMGINVEDGVNRFQNLIKDCLQEMQPETDVSTQTSEWLQEQKEKLQELITMKEEIGKFKFQSIELLEKKIKSSAIQAEINKLDKKLKALQDKVKELEKSLPPGLSNP